MIGAERFLREIKTIATLQHPHILGLIDCGEVNGTAYYVMPFVEGESLCATGCAGRSSSRSPTPSASPARWPPRSTTPTATA